MSKNLYIVPYDFTPVSEKALEYALFLGSKVRSEIKLLNVAVDKPKGMKAKARLEELCEKMKTPPTVELTHAVRVGSIFTDIGKAAKKDHAQLIIMGTHGKRGLQSVFGSHAMKVVTSAECPFLIVQKGTEVKDVKNIIVPIDLTKESLQIINIAGDMSNMLKAKIHVLAEDQSDQILHTRLHNRLSIVKDQYEDRDITPTIEITKKRGSFEKKINQYAAANEGGMLAIAYHSESLLPQFDTFAQNLMCNKAGLPFLVVNSKLASSLYFQEIMNLGEVNTLRVLRFTSVGAYLGDEEDNDVLLPNKYLNGDLSIDSEVEVYLYRDSEDRLVATTERPLIDLYGFAYLQTKAVNFFGAFMDWGLEKDLMVPFKEQKLKFEEGRYYLVTLQLDEATDRLFASAKVHRYLEECTEDFDPKKEVELLICEQTELGVKVIVENKFSGLIFNSDISRPVTPGQRTTGYVAKVREDGKLDVRLDPTSYAKVSGSAEKILDTLKRKKFIPLTDKSHPDDIRETLEMSKKTFKQAIGNLYRERLIRLEKDGIHLSEDQKSNIFQSLSL